MIPSEISFPGDIVSADLVADRRGSRIWKLQLAGGELLALKYATDNQSAQGIQHTARLLAAREANVLRALDYDGYLYADGQSDSGTWIAVQWIDAPTISRRWAAVRKNDNPKARAEATTAAQQAIVALSDLHASGWRHADLQADHILISDQGPARLLDFALAQGPADVKPEVVYRGALAHLSAPEIAAELLATADDHSIELTNPAEVYTFGAILFTIWSGQWPTDYEADPRTLTTTAIYERICDTGSRRAMPDGWPQMAELIEATVERDSANRPTFAELGAMLSTNLARR